MQGVEVWNQWREENFLLRPDLSHLDLSKKNFAGAKLFGVDLSHANLCEANLSGTDFQEARLTAANLYGANLVWANLGRANLCEANLQWVNFYVANLSGANLTKTSLQVANFTSAQLYNADFNEAVMWATVFGDIDLQEVKGLETIEHLGPSIIGVDTLYKSKGEPKLFFQRAGVPDELINYLEKIKTPKCRYTLETLELWINNNQKLLLTLSNRLAHYQDQEAKYGPLQVPFSTVEEINATKAQIEEVKSQIAEWQRLKDLYY